MMHIAYGSLKKIEELFRVLAEKNRIRIIRLLLYVDEACVCELVDALCLPQYTVSRHLSALKRAGIVIELRKGTWKYYSVLADSQSLTGKLLEIIKTEVNEELLEHDLTLFKNRLSLRVNGKCVVGTDGLCCHGGNCNDKGSKE